MMGVLRLCLSLACLLHVTWESPVESCADRKTPTDVTQINGLWNLKAISTSQSRYLVFLTEISYGFMKLSATEEVANMTGFFSPMVGISGRHLPLDRVHSEDDSLTYGFTAGQASGSSTHESTRRGLIGTLTFVQPLPDTLVIYQREKGNLTVSILYIRSTSVPESEMEHFRQYVKCKDFPYFKEFPVAKDYAQKCFGLFEEPKHLEEIQDDFTSLHLLAKSSSAADHHYNLRILYTARLEISNELGEYTIREIITAPADTTLLELKYINKTSSGRLRVLKFKTEEDLFLLGVENESGKTLYLASKKPTASQAVIETFKKQAECFETKYNYLIPGSIKKDDDAAGACADKLEQRVPIKFRESIGKWILTVSAHQSAEAALSDILPSHGITEISLVDDKLQVSHTSIHEGAVSTLEKDHIEVEENTGHIIYKDTPSGTRTAVNRVSDNCIMFTPALSVGILYLNCRSGQVIPMEEIRKFVHYANCRKYNNIVIRKHTSLVCSDLPTEVRTLDVQKITGTWKLAAIASNVAQSDVFLPPEIQFVVNNEDVTITDGSWSSTLGKVGDRRLHFAKAGESVMEMRFHEPLGDSLLSWVGNTTEHKVFLVLFSKSGRATAEDVAKFKHFASCLSIAVTFVHE
ncbi:uncharacterized protein LOC134949489 [Pseudophryne corroboree]|uniref:uncharacterized protein LOC134949489 n=1 Tax=Pseudophryne corroboree TaxID=495146 RepID=UPI00308198C7